VDPTDHLAYYYRCLALVSSDPASAARDCEASIGLRPDFAGAHLGMSAALLALGHTDKSYSEANEAIRLDAQSPVGYALRGRVSAVARRYSESARDYQNAIRLTRPNGRQ
jgi:tetratricopeptide (TPR) repeat protein